MQLKPTGKRLLIEKIESEKKGLLLIERKDEPYMAKVIALGDKSEIPAKVGDTLLMTPYSGFSLDKDSQHMIVGDNDVIGVYRE